MRRWVWPLLALAAVLLGGAAPAPTTDNHRIIAVGDLHGDYDAWTAIARASGLVDAKGKWAAGGATFVQLGDVVDRGPGSLKIIHDLMRLQREASRRGGKVIVLVGNHEAMNMTNDLRYVHPGEFASYSDGNSARLRDRIYDANRAAIDAAYRAQDPKITANAMRERWIKATPLGKIEHQIAWKPTGEIGKWVISNPAVAVVGDSLFVHGGISAAYASVPVNDLNRRVADALKAQDERPDAIINDPRGPLWYRGLVTREPLDETTATPPSGGPSVPLTIEQEIALVLGAYRVKRIVVGHTPSLAGIISSDNGQLWRADSGNSQAYGGIPSYLEIIGDRVTAHRVPRPTPH